MSLESIIIKAPAKINLRLKVVGRRADGFHLLSMLNACIALFDELRVARADDGLNLKVEGDTSLATTLNAETSNLVSAAARLFLESFAIESGLSITLSKHIPIGAGLGGGSSDAAATLLALRHLFEPTLARRISDDELVRIGCKLGSDVPYFIRRGLCRVSGIGEQIEQASKNPLEGCKFLLVCPKEHSSTAEVYKSFSRRVSRHDLQTDSAFDHIPSSYQGILDLIDNDLAQDFVERSEQARLILDMMHSFPSARSGVTGSGSALFCLPCRPDDVAVLERVQAALPAGVPSKLLNFC